MAKRAAATGTATSSSGVRWTEQQARDVLEAWETSGESIAAFARHQGLVPQRLFWWRRRLEREKSPQPSAAFVPVTIRAAQEATFAAPSAPIVLTLEPHVRVEVHATDATTAAWLATLLVAMREQRS